MNQNEAKLKLVEAESELKVGDAIVINLCDFCGKKDVYLIKYITKYSGTSQTLMVNLNSKKLQLIWNFT